MRPSKDTRDRFKKMLHRLMQYIDEDPDCDIKALLKDVAVNTSKSTKQNLLLRLKVYAGAREKEPGKYGGLGKGTDPRSARHDHGTSTVESSPEAHPRSSGTNLNLLVL